MLHGSMCIVQQRPQPNLMFTNYTQWVDTTKNSQ